MARSATTEVKVGGKQLRLSNLDKVLYPEVGFTKGQVIDYYTRIAPVLLPHLKNHPLTLKRYPNGVEDKYFYEKQSPSHRPDWVKTVAVPARGRTIDFTLANDLPTLVWLANLADLELHTSLSKANNIQRPTTLAFDLDPGPPATIVECSQVALWLRDIFKDLKLESFPKTSGSKGMQLYVPLNTPSASYDKTKPFAKALAELLTKQHPKHVVSSMKKELRPKKVLIDWSQNDEHKTTINVYSLRAKARPTVSTPLTWKEVEKILDSGDPDTAVFDSDDVLERVEKQGDLFEPVAKLKQKLPDL
ncbi:MAG TPA: non-homologous end-joining DNA ligase [Thermoleophilaceae bacterium]